MAALNRGVLRFAQDDILYSPHLTRNNVPFPQKLRTRFCYGIGVGGTSVPVY